MKLKRFTASVLTVFMVFMCMSVPNVSFAAEQTGDFIPGRVIVGLNGSGESLRSSSSIFSGLDVTEVTSLTTQTPSTSSSTLRSQSDQEEVVLVRFNGSKKSDVLAAIKKLEANPNVEYAEPDYIVYSVGTTSKVASTNLYNLNKVDAPRAWGIFTGSSDVVVGVVDSGINYNHPALKNNMWTNPGEIAGDGIDNDNNGYIDDIHGWDFYDNDSNPMDGTGHGTHCAGIIAAVGNAEYPYIGIAYNTKVAALKMQSSDGIGSASAVVAAINYATAMGFPITNNSWGSQEKSTAVRNAIARTSLFVAAAGNKSRNIDIEPYYPSSYDCSNIISVASTNANDIRASYSNYGPKSVDIAAPGENVLSSYKNNTYETLDGTSMAAPHVAATAALLKGYYKQMSTAEMKKIILASTDKVDALERLVGSGGRLNVYRALLKSYDYQSFGLQINTTLEATDSNYKFFMTHYDIIVIKKKNTASKTTEVYALTASSNYQEKKFIATLPLGETGSEFDFVMDRNANIYAIKKSGTGTNSTEIHMLTYASGYQKFGLQTGTALAETGSNFEFLMGKNKDIYAIKKNGTTSGKTEVYVLTAASGYQQFGLQTKTPVERTYSNFEFIMDSEDNIYAIKKNNTESGKTEVHMLTAASKYQQFGLQTKTPLEETYTNFQFMIGRNKDIYAIKKRSSIGTTGVHVLLK